MNASDLALIGFAVLTTLFAASVFLITVADRSAAARRLLWLGAVGPFLFTVSKTADQAAEGAGPLDIVRGGLPLGCLLAAVMLQPARGRSRANSVTLSLTLFLAICVASTAWSVDPRSTLLKGVVLLSAFGCLMSLAVRYETLDEGIRAVAALAHTFLLAVAAGFLFFPGWAYAGVIQDPLPRLQGLVPSIAPNILAWVAGFGLLLLLLRIGPAWTVRAPWRQVLLVLYLLEILGSRTRTATALWLAIIAFVALRRAGRSLGALVGVITVGFGLLVAVATLARVLAAFLQRGQSLSNIRTLTGRTVVWQQAYELWQSQPLTGFGFYSGHRFALPAANRSLQEYSNIDNTWLEVLLDVGVIGLFALILFVLASASAIRRAAARARKADESTLAALLLWSTMAAFVSIAFINPTIQANSATMVIAGFVILLAAAHQRDPVDQASGVTPGRRGSGRGRATSASKPLRIRTTRAGEPRTTAPAGIS